MGLGLPPIDTKSTPAVGTCKKKIDDQEDSRTDLLEMLAEERCTETN